MTDQGSRSDRVTKMFRRSNIGKEVSSILDSDGLPYVGQVCLQFSPSLLLSLVFIFSLIKILMSDFQMIKPEEPYCSIYNEVTSSTHTYKRKGSEPVYVDYVSVDVKNKKHLQKVSFFL